MIGKKFELGEIKRIYISELGYVMCTVLLKKERISINYNLGKIKNFSCVV